MCLVAHIVRGGCFAKAVEQGLLRDHLFDDARKVYDLVLAHYAKYGKIPDSNTVKNDTGVDVPDLAGVKEPFEYYLDKAKERARDNLAKEGVKTQLRAMEAGRTEEAIDAAAKLSEDLTRMNLQSDPVDDWTKHTDVREREYKDAKAIGTGILGIETPWPGLNDLTQGIQDGDFWVMVARPGTGKTWMLVVMAIFAWLKGHIPLFISMEMPKKKIKRRMDAVHMKLDYRSLKCGQLGMGIEDEYFKGLVDLQNADHPLYVASSRNVKRIRDIAVLTRLYQPSIIFLDGLYKLRPPNIGVSSYWERIQAIANDLQLLNGDLESKLVATSQLRREGGKSMKKKRGAAVDFSLEDIAFADAIGQNADVVMGLGATKRMVEDHEMVMMLIKNREDERGAWVTQFDPGMGAFSEIEEYEVSTPHDDTDGGDDASVGY